MTDKPNHPDESNPGLAAMAGVNYLEVPSDSTAVFRRPDGACFYVTIDGNDLFIHGAAAEPMRFSAGLRYEENCHNEGWMALDVIERSRP